MVDKTMCSERPKRKRAQVNYYQADSDIDDEDTEQAGQPSPTGVDTHEDQHEDDSETESDEDDYYPNKRLEAQADRTKAIALKAKEEAKEQKRKERPFPFMSLPAEIRNMIYKYALVETAKDLSLVTNHTSGLRRAQLSWDLDAPYTGGWKTIWQNPKDGHSRLAPALLLANHQINAEATPFLYRQPIYFEQPSALNTFLNTIGHDNRLLLQEIILNSWNRGLSAWQASMLPAFAMLATAKNIRRIRLESPSRNRDMYTHWPWLSGYANRAKWFSDQVRAWAAISDTYNGEGSSKGIIEFGISNFGTQAQLEKEPDVVEENRKAFMDSLNF